MGRYFRRDAPSAFKLKFRPFVLHYVIEPIAVPIVRSLGAIWNVLAHSPLTIVLFMGAAIVLWRTGFWLSAGFWTVLAILHANSYYQHWQWQRFVKRWKQEVEANG